MTARTAAARRSASSAGIVADGAKDALPVVAVAASSHDGPPTGSAPAPAPAMTGRFWNYYSTIRVTPMSADGTSFVEWWAVYDCESADADAMEDLLAVTLFGGGLATVRARFAAG